jgi:hypothetical protein
MARGESGEAPAELVAFARAALAGRTTDADLAELTFDSLLDSCGEARRRLEFCAPSLSIDLEVEGRTLSGRLAPAALVRVEVEAADGAIVTSGEADSDGRFRLILRQGGRLRLRLVPAAPGVPLVESSWVTF